MIRPPLGPLGAAFDTGWGGANAAATSGFESTGGGGACCFAAAAAVGVGPDAFAGAFGLAAAPSASATFGCCTGAFSSWPA
jgi:hypothetical protein